MATPSIGYTTCPQTKYPSLSFSCGHVGAEGTAAPGLAVNVVELAPEAAGKVLKEVLDPRLASPLGGIVLRRTFSVPPDAPLEDFVRAAQSHPVFEIVSDSKN